MKETPTEVGAETTLFYALHSFQNRGLVSPIIVRFSADAPLTIMDDLHNGLFFSAKPEVHEQHLLIQCFVGADHVLIPQWLIPKIIRPSPIRPEVIVSSPPKDSSPRSNEPKENSPKSSSPIQKLFARVRTQCLPPPPPYPRSPSGLFSDGAQRNFTHKPLPPRNYVF